MKRADELRTLELQIRIRMRRERWCARLASGAPDGGADRGGPDTFPRSQTLRMVLAHPGVAAGAFAAAAMLGPSRLIRWAAMLLPLLRR